MTETQHTINAVIESCLEAYPYTLKQFRKLTAYVEELELQNIKLLEENELLSARMDMENEYR